MPFREIDADRLAEAEREKKEAAERADAEERELVRAFRRPWFGAPRGTVAERALRIGRLACAAAFVVPALAWGLVGMSRALAATGLYSTLAASACALAAMVSGALAVRDRRQRRGAVITLLVGALGLAWALFVAVVCLLSDGNMLPM
jgi:hypothetical protein